jgi:transcriptional regulator with XRE-family HTH domain
MTQLAIPEAKLRSTAPRRLSGTRARRVLQRAFAILLDRKNGLGYTQATLSEETGWSQSSISRFQLGERVPDRAVQERLCQFFDYSYTDWVEMLIAVDNGVMPPEMFVRPGEDWGTDVTPFLNQLQSASIVDALSIAIAALERIKTSVEQASTSMPTHQPQSQYQKLLEHFGKRALRMLWFTHEQMDELSRGQMPTTLTDFQVSLLRDMDDTIILSGDGVEESPE